MSKPFTSYDKTAPEQITRVTRDRKGGHQGSWIDGQPCSYSCGNTQEFRKFSKHTKKRLLRREHKKATQQAVAEFNADAARGVWDDYLSDKHWQAHFEFIKADELNPEFRVDDEYYDPYDDWYYAGYRQHMEDYRRQEALEEYHAEVTKACINSVVVGMHDVGSSLKHVLDRNGFRLLWSYGEERWMVVPKVY